MAVGDLKRIMESIRLEAQFSERYQSLSCGHIVSVLTEIIEELSKRVEELEEKVDEIEEKLEER